MTHPFNRLDDRRERVARAQRMALCKRLRETGMQTGPHCDGDTVLCGCCHRTVDALAAAAIAAMEGK